MDSTSSASSVSSVSLNRYIEPPPRLMPSAEALPHLGGLKLAPHKVALPDEMELFHASPLKDAFDDAAASRMLKHALGLPKVCDRLGQGRVVPIGVSCRGEVAKGERRTYLAVAYDYSANVAVEIHLDDKGELLELKDERYQPPPIQIEIERAIGLARNDARIAHKLGGLVAMAIPFEGADNEFAERRVIEVLFGCRSERLPKYRAWVDLGTENVLHAGESCECCSQQDQHRGQHQEQHQEVQS